MAVAFKFTWEGGCRLFSLGWGMFDTFNYVGRGEISSQKFNTPGVGGQDALISKK